MSIEEEPRLFSLLAANLSESAARASGAKGGGSGTLHSAFPWEHLKAGELHPQATTTLISHIILFSEVSDKNTS